MEILVQFLFYHIEMPEKRKRDFSNKENQNNISALCPDGWYTGLSAYYQNGQQGVIFWTTCRLVGQCQESYLELQLQQTESEWQHVEETPVFQRYDMLIWLLDKSEC